jgi:MFS family permease
MKWRDAFLSSFFFFGQYVLMQTVTPILIPLLVQQFLGVAGQASAYGQIRLWSLLTALLVQALAGMLSDRTTSRWGRRRPFILVGTLINIGLVVALGLLAQTSGPNGYWILFGLILLLQASANTAMGAAQGLIPDLAPPAQRGRFSALKAIFEAPVPLILVGLTVGPLIAAGNLWGGLAVVIVCLLASLIVTMFAPEVPLAAAPPPLAWEPFLRLAGMTAAFAVTLLLARALIQLVLTWLGRVDLMTAAMLGGILGEVTLIVMAAATVGGVLLSLWVARGRAARGDRPFAWWVISRLFFLTGAVNLSSFALYYVQSKLGLAGAAAAAPTTQLFVVIGLIILLLALPAGRLTDRIGRRPTLMAAAALAASAALVLVVARTLPVMYVGGALFGLAGALFYPASWALGTELAPAGQSGLFMGISNLAGAGAGALGAYLGGPVADYLSLKLADSLPSLGYEVLFGVFGALFIASALALLGVPQKA